jgi:hypothetical protein
MAVVYQRLFMLSMSNPQIIYHIQFCMHGILEAQCA